MILENHPMNAALLCLALLAADAPSAVRAKVLYGSGPHNEQAADIELWISQAMAKNGSPLAKSYTGWIALTGDEQSFYSANGFFIDGTVTERNGMYEVEINGCDGFPIQQTATLKPGERRVFKLTDNPAPNNVFIALEAPLSERVTLEAKVGRDGSQVRFSHEDDTTIIDITSEFGIDEATIRRKSDKWPKAIQVRLHLSGLESFKAGGDDVAVEWPLPTTSPAHPATPHPAP